jgi:hypothetical protein
MSPQTNDKGEVLIPVSDLVPAVWSKGTYSWLKNNGKLTTDVRGGNGRHVSVYYDRLNDHYKRHIIEVLGDPRVMLGLTPSLPAEQQKQRYTRPDYNNMKPAEQELCNARWNLVRCYREFTELHAEEMGVMGAKREFVEMVRGGMLCTESFPVVGTVSYVGDCIDNKPASLKRNELWHRNEREKAIAKSGMPTLWGAYKVAEWWISEYNNRVRTGRYLPDVSPMALAAEQMQLLEIGGRTLEGRAMDCMIMNSKTAKLKRNGFKVNGTWYYNYIFTALVGGGEEFLLKYDILASERILVFHEDGTFLCEAKVSPFQNMHAMAALGSDADRSKLRHVAGQQRAIERAVVEAVTGRNDGIMTALPEATTSELPPAADLQLIAASSEPEPEMRLF